eukprot:12500982-Ditylum_brightwellii.AAC.1
MRWLMKRCRNKASKQHAAELFAHVEPLCPPITASFKHCRQYVEKGLPSSVPKSSSALFLWTNRSCTCSTYGINWAEKELATNPCNCYSSGNTLLNRYVDGHSDKSFDACLLAEAIKAANHFSRACSLSFA